MATVAVTPPAMDSPLIASTAGDTVGGAMPTCTAEEEVVVTSPAIDNVMIHSK